VFVQCGHFADKEGGSPSDADVRTFCTKNFGFFEIYGVFARTRGVEPVQTFCGQGGGVDFSRFCADVFYGQPLTIKQWVISKIKFFLFSVRGYTVPKKVKKYCCTPLPFKNKKKLRSSKLKSRRKKLTIIMPWLLWWLLLCCYNNTSISRYNCEIISMFYAGSGSRAFYKPTGPALW